MQTVAIVIGHSIRSKGACHSTGMCEFDFNIDLAHRIEKELGGCKVHLVYRRSYRGLPTKVNKLKPDVIVSLHCNAFNRRASGCETLYYYRSRKSEKLAKVIQSGMVSALGNKDRGVKPKSTEDRGGYLLRYTKAPCVILEPFFIDNTAELNNATAKTAQLSLAISTAIKHYLGS